MRILQVSSSDVAGGAEKIAWNLFQRYRERGHESHLAVRIKRSDDPAVLPIPNESRRPRWARFWLRAGGVAENPLPNAHGSTKAQLFRGIAEPRRVVQQKLGFEDFDFPGTWDLLNLPPHKPDILHCHNLHGDYFDLRALPWLSKELPVFVSLHDAWLLSGHCSHHFDCERWETGCGQCPDLTIYPAIRRDATARNWQRKKEIFSRSRVYLATPCQWLMNKVENSLLAPAIIDKKIIPYGVDCCTFKPADKNEARKKLGIPSDAKVVLFAANKIKKNIWKDYDTMRAAVVRAAEHIQHGELIFAGLGDDAPPERFTNGQFRFYPFRSSAAEVATFYQAADVYLHAANADTFPNAVLEALASGAPVIATAVGGIPEQVDEGRTGYLIPRGDVRAMSERIVTLLSDESLLQAMSKKAAEVARQRFNPEREVNAYLDWYQAALKQSAVSP